MTKFCPECGFKQKDENNHFCSNCGYDFSKLESSDKDSNSPDNSSINVPITSGSDESVDSAPISSSSEESVDTGQVGFDSEKSVDSSHVSSTSDSSSVSKPRTSVSKISHNSNNQRKSNSSNKSRINNKERLLIIIALIIGCIVVGLCVVVLWPNKKGTISGFVADEATGDPVTGVTVIATDSKGKSYTHRDNTDTTGRDGYFKLELPEGSYTLEFDGDSQGYEHYEISNFALPGYRSKHNSSYWKRIPYLGIGAAAHSYNLTSRQWNVSDVKLYIKGDNLVEDCELLDATEQYNDLITTALRTREGIDLGTLSETDFHYLTKAANKSIEQGNLLIENNHLHLTRKGLFISDAVMVELIK